VFNLVYKSEDRVFLFLLIRPSKTDQLFLFLSRHLPFHLTRNLTSISKPRIHTSPANKASLAIWDKLGFNRVGLIPDAGRLKTGPNGEEEYVDAVVIHKSFV
jgi:hypothetical protein